MDWPDRQGQVGIVGREGSVSTVRVTSDIDWVYRTTAERQSNRQPETEENGSSSRLWA